MKMELSHLRKLEAESIHIIREVAGECSHPVMLYSAGKDSSVMLRLAQKAFFPSRIPFPLLHVDTGFKFPEMIEFRDNMCKEIGCELIVHKPGGADRKADPFRLGTQQCCAILKTEALLSALRKGGFDAAFGGARREEEASRGKERIYSFRDHCGQWDPKHQRPEPWNILNSRIGKGESIRVFPLSNWTEIDVWEYIERERIPVVPLYFAKARKVIVRAELLVPFENDIPLNVGEAPQTMVCRMRSLGCTYCTGAIRSDAKSVPEIIKELRSLSKSERLSRIIDHDQPGSMELKKRVGYF